MWCMMITDVHPKETIEIVLRRRRGRLRFRRPWTREGRPVNRYVINPASMIDVRLPETMPVLLSDGSLWHGCYLASYTTNPSGKRFTGDTPLDRPVA